VRRVSRRDQRLALAAERELSKHWYFESSKLREQLDEKIRRLEDVTNQASRATQATGRCGGGELKDIGIRLDGMNPIWTPTENRTSMRLQRLGRGNETLGNQKEKQNLHFCLTLRRLNGTKKVEKTG
jgi:hypothetical protein